VDREVTQADKLQHRPASATQMIIIESHQCIMTPTISLSNLFCGLLCTGLFLVVENKFSSETMKTRKGRDKLSIIDSFYFVATTISTVG
jgi:hypothetical protein